MNLLLLDEEDFVADDRAVVRGRRLQHVLEVHRAKLRQRLRVGRVGGRIGEGLVVRLDEDALELEVQLDRDPPEAPDLRVVLALPRPKVLRRVLTSLITLGVKRIVVLHSFRVEKSYWQSPMLSPEAIDLQVRLSLEQAVDTVPPVIEMRRFFKPFVEDQLDEFARGSRRWLAHPVGATPAPVEFGLPATLGFGPEGGFIPYEVQMLRDRGFEVVSLGSRMHRVETAVAMFGGRARMGGRGLKG